MEKNALILDLCSGLHGWSEVWKRNGFKIESLDINPAFKPTYCMDVLKFKPVKMYKVIFASPPCTYFSFARYHLTSNEERIEGLNIAGKCFDIIDKYAEYYIVENPFWKYSLNYFIQRPDHHKIDYCMYGYGYKKPTSIWTNIDLDFRTCIHKKGSHPSSKLQQYSSKQRAKIPVSLAQHVYDVLNNNY